ncbi:3-alpha--hydroxysteroid dehydrogenase [Naematelia encephala]|uniref:3-alpha--hydroxysteroid dehydrogenase n=1 Tax=Naematelia encephala TaxID=71784 RepID=A0A1Y2AKM8_9TREE|nr:3-alpha--hydroxysteroid dehydrogenase [Naematelia encephala]
MSRMSGKIALVTGGSSGIGKASVDLFVQHGAKVVVIDLAEPEEPETPFPDEVILVRGSVESEDNWETAMRAAQDAFGGIPNVLVQSAGVPGRARLTDTTLEQWTHVFDINVHAVFLGMKTFITALLEAGQQGSIVNISSLAGITGMRAGAAYEASKAACTHMCKSAAVEYAQQGIRVNCVAPGLTITGMTRKSDRPASSVQGFMDHTPMRRWGTATEVGYAILYLSSDEASYVTGQAFAHDGGYSAM